MSISPVPWGLRLPLLAAVAIFSFVSPGFAQTGTLTLKDALTRAVEASPALRSQRFAVSAAAARIDQARLRPAFELGVEAENILGTNRLSVIDDAEVTLRLGTVVELGDKRGRRIDAATAERDLALTQNDGERLDIMAEVARRFIRLVQAQEERNLAARRLELAERTERAVGQRVQAARSPRLEGQNAAIATGKARIDQSQADSAVRRAWAELAAGWSGDITAPQSASADLFAMPGVAGYPVLASAIERNPSILRFASERRVQEAKLRLAQSQANPDVTVSAGIRRLQGDRSNAMVLSASIPLGSGARAQPYISEAMSLRDQIPLKEQAARAELLGTVYVAAEKATEARKEAEALLSTAVPQAAEAQKLAEDGYTVGRFSLLELITAQQQLTDLQRQAIAAAVAFHESLLEIERLTGRSAADRDNPNSTGTP